MMLHTTYKALGLLVSDKKIFKIFVSKIYFSQCNLYMQQTRTIWTIIKVGYIRIIPAKLG